ncbi:putative alcohol dehydrogenase [[Clostridium] ultunense Esp]|uniref:Putative alcohol dehydrogenase n=1 Tax=[Clostridium] ultunense Esp TaxID=1288971 RepID=M1Z4L6_9FIRM|nr:iron-containing alcohol dehydrogenase [Schnuerera ultunensis]CCQ92986.1 putative alcohol dehydrogenase [[Clostridium] ultunense Esp]SHD76449.1 putative alcohol dehydrogenase [[Clostridium] ultunense Esp]
MLPEYYEFKNSVKIISGKNALENIPFELSNLEAKRPLILTTKSMIRNGQLKIVTDAMENANIEVGLIFKDIPQDSSIEIVNSISQLYKENNCDSIVAIGGGSVIDTAKGVNMLVSTNATDLKEYMGLEILGGKLNPFIAVPSTSGTGSEATLVSVIADTSRKVKMEFISYSILPDVAVLDPRMTATLPSKLTASTGIDALTHSIEAFSGFQKNPISDVYALTSIELISNYLEKAVVDGKDEKARLAMANGSLMAGIAFSNSMVGIVHAIGHACGGVCNVPHGDAMTILLPHCMNLNLELCQEEYGRILLAFSGPEVYSQTPREDRGRRCIDEINKFINKFNEICGLPNKLRDVGVKKEDFETIAKTAINDGAAIVNPVEVTFDRVMKILEEAY